MWSERCRLGDKSSRWLPLRRCHLKLLLASCSTRPVEEWVEVYGDLVMAAAIFVRLRHHNHGVMIRGDSFQLMEKRRSGLFRPQTGSSSLPTFLAREMPLILIVDFKHFMMTQWTIPLPRRLLPLIPRALAKVKRPYLPCSQKSGSIRILCSAT